MRLTERIQPFLEKVDIEMLLNDWFGHWEKSTIHTVIKEYHSRRKLVEAFWIAQPDLRFGQVLVNMALIPNIPGMWYYDEDDEILISQGHEPRDIMFWGRNYTKDMVRLEKTEWILIKDMSTDHIQAVIDGKFTGNLTYLKAFNAELIRRKNEK